jgi:hypothetical protein
MTTVRELADELNMTIYELWEFAPDLPSSEGAEYVISEEETAFIREAVERSQS